MFCYKIIKNDLLYQNKKLIFNNLETFKRIYFEFVHYSENIFFKKIYVEDDLQEELFKTASQLKQF
jgi:hypothetical protein